MADIPLSIDSTGLRSSAESARGVREWLPLLVFGFYALAVLLIGSTHEAWFDEAQAWLIARDASAWEIVSRYARYEGTPPLWHLVLWLPAHLGYPYRYLWLISSAFGLVGAGMVLFRSPFPLLVRCGLVFGYFFAFQYPIVARSYALDLALFPILAALFERRLERPFAYCAALALLANANTHSFLISGIIALEFGAATLRSNRWREPKLVVAMTFYGVFACGAVACAWPPKDISFHAYKLGAITATRAILLMAEPFIERVDVWGNAGPEVGARAAGAVATLFLLIPSLVLFARARIVSLFLAALGIFFIFTAAKYGQGWHTGILFMVWMFALWISWPKLKLLSRREHALLFVSLAIVLGVQDWYSVAAWKREVLQTYSPAKDLAKALIHYRQTHPGTTVAAFGIKTFAAQPWAKVNLFDNFDGGPSKPAFYDWRASQPFKRFATLTNWAHAVQWEHHGVLLLSDFEAIDQDEAAQYFAIAAKAGFCAHSFDGEMIWKTYDRESEKIVMFTHCAA
ncbi:MAG TPA: hypothetical protein VL358_04340 [Caulobacteraceae bacterium]|jgi:hypothetical protein|nr:hypothetical protein [Caulobacteraceae bacterium]